jgi:SAM-dependent methyltransferase
MTKEAGRIPGLYERHAEAFDRLRGRSLFERAWLDRFIAILPAEKSVLDLGCGMDEPVAQYLIGQGCKVTGLDSSPALIALCRERFPQQTWLVGDMRSFAHGESFGGVLAWDSFFHLTAMDQREMFPIFRAHAQKGTALMFTSGPEPGKPSARSRASRSIMRASIPGNTGSFLAQTASSPSLTFRTIRTAAAIRSGWPGASEPRHPSK